MKRRTFFGAAASATLAGPLSATQAAARAPLNIDGVELWRFEGTRIVHPGRGGQYQVQPLHVYDEFRPKPYHENPDSPPREARTSAVYLKLRTSGGLDGWYGPVDNEAAIVVDQQLRSFVIGKDALAGEAMWDQMYRSNRHSRHGHFLMAISAIDNALWDVRGRYYNAPVYRLLGGPTRAKVTVYGSCLGYSIEPDAARKRAGELVAQGYRHQKWFLAYGPGDGAEGLQKNVALVRAVREGAGETVDLMFDAYSGWNLDYATAWAKQVEQYRPRWIEEAFHPEKIDSFAELRRKTSIPVATGEHLYGRWEVYEYLKAGAISVVQSDPEWCGGVSELVKICSVASIYDAQVIPHGHSIHAALHVVASQSPMTCPMIEYLINKMESYYHFEKQPYVVENGAVALPQAPGFGIDFDESRIEKRTLLKWS